MAECLVKTVGFSGFLKSVLVIIMLLFCVSVVFTVLDVLGFKGLLLVCFMEGWEVIGGLLMIGSDGKGMSFLGAVICCFGLLSFGFSIGLFVFVFLLGLFFLLYES